MPTRLALERLVDRRVVEQHDPQVACVICWRPRSIAAISSVVSTYTSRRSGVRRSRASTSLGSRRRSPSCPTMPTSSPAVSTIRGPRRAPPRRLARGRQPPRPAALVMVMVAEHRYDGTADPARTRPRGRSPAPGRRASSGRLRGARGRRPVEPPRTPPSRAPATASDACTSPAAAIRTRSLTLAHYPGITTCNPGNPRRVSSNEAMQSFVVTLKRVAAILRDEGIPFALGGRPRRVGARRPGDRSRRRLLRQARRRTTRPGVARRARGHAGRAAARGVAAEGLGRRGARRPRLRPERRPGRRRRGSTAQTSCEVMAMRLPVASLVDVS